jgi:signal transduction histidine kinase
MRLNGKHVGAPVRLLVLFVVFSAIPLTALGWLGWLMLDQERELEAKREQEQVDNAAEVLARELERALVANEDQLRTAVQDRGAAAHALPPDTVLLIFDSSGILGRQGIALPYYPRVPAPGEVSADIASVEALEWSGKLNEAAAAYRKLSETANRDRRAAALVRLARTLRQQHRITEALNVYSELAELKETLVRSDPSELIARRERIVLLRTMGTAKAAAEESGLLATALIEGRFRIDRTTFEFYSEFATVSPSSAKSSLELAEAVDGLWPFLNQELTGRKAWSGGKSAQFAVWRREKGVTAAIVGSVENLTASLAGFARNFHVDLRLEDPEIVVHEAAGGSIKTARETGLPWTIRVTGLGTSAVDVEYESRRNLLVAGFVLIVLVISTAGYVVFRAVNRELNVARLQSDFVSAVSHEFRTPLAAMCHLTEMLEEGGVAQERLFRYYQALGRESRRLHGMVENLLDFGRMESGRRTYQMEEANPVVIAEQVVDDFKEQLSATTDRLQWKPPGNDCGTLVRADRDALTLALRNLIDNALKYSPESTTVNVSVEERNGLAGISVEDHGPGIPKHEQRQIFRKFVRGASAKQLNVKGTGIGLAMAYQIVRAHGGRLDLASRTGQGSRFTIWLPVQPEDQRL